MSRKTPKPRWLSRRIPRPGLTSHVSELLQDLSLHTVCQAAQCPNQSECFGRGTATFLLLGPNCTRRCTFCAVGKGKMAPPQRTEPDRIAEAVARMGLTFCVLTMVTRDDLDDGGAEHVARTVSALRTRCPDVRIEVLVSDLGGSKAAQTTVCSITISKPCRGSILKSGPRPTTAAPLICWPRRMLSGRGR